MDQGFKKLDENHCFQIFAYFVMMRNDSHPQYIEMHLIVSLLVMLAAILWKLAGFLPELKATVDSARQAPRITREAEVQTDPQEAPAGPPRDS